MVVPAPASPPLPVPQAPCARLRCELTPTQVAGGPAACYQELSQFPAITCTTFGATTGAQTFLLYTECSRPDLPHRRLLRFSRHYSPQRVGSSGLTVIRAVLSAEIHHPYGMDGLRDGAAVTVLSSADEVVELYRELSRHPGLKATCLSPDVTAQHGDAVAPQGCPGALCLLTGVDAGVLTLLLTEWAQRDLERGEYVKFCCQLLSRESPSGALKAVLRKVPGKEKKEEKQFLEVWDQNCKVKSIDLTAPDKHGTVYDDGYGVPRQRVSPAQPARARQAAQGSWRAGAGQAPCARLLPHALAACLADEQQAPAASAAEQGPMASGTEQGAEAASSPAACYRELSRFPAVTRAALRATTGAQTFLLYTECSRPDLPHRRLLRFSRHYSLRRVGSGGLTVIRVALSAEIHHQLLSKDSPTGQRRAVLSRCPWQGHELLEVWDSNGRSHSVDLTALGKHGEVYTEGPFACLAWSHSETRLLYVAEKSRPKPRPPCPWDAPGAGRPAEEDEEDEQFVYREDWGEALSTRSVPVLCVLDLEGSSLSVLEGIPEHLSPGQALWSPNDCGVVFVGWWHEPFRLGLSACSNRRSGIFHLDLASGCCELLSSEHGAACSPRLSPDGRRLLYLEGGLGGPHRQCLRLRMLTWQTRQTVTVLDVVQEPTEAFAGLYTEVLPPRCWAADSRRAVLGTPQRSRMDLLLVDTEAATVTNLTAGSPEGCWELLTLQWDLLVATCSAPHRPPSLVVAVLPPAGQELPLCWVPVEDTPTVPGVTWKTLTIQPPCSGQSPATHGTQAFEALLLSPPDGKAPHPLVVCPHGGPHAVFDARWRPSMAALCQLGFAVLLVNYRGSLGFGQASISSLLSRVGEQDVADTQLAVEQALCSEPLDPHRLALLAGSHGAFIALHLLTREPERYRACALRSPVSNLPALLGTSDIPDWRYISLGLPYSFERVPRAEEVATMLLRSPITQAGRVQTPVLLCVGARDRRVSPTQALELYRVLRARGVPARLLWYPEGGHALAGVETEADVFGNCARWLLRHLGQPQQDGTGQHSP